MTYNQLFSQFQEKYGHDHDYIFFDLVFYCSKIIKTKEDFISKRNNEINFKARYFWKYCNDYFKKMKPLAHITGHALFCNLDFIINKKVLSPRDITEQMTWDFIKSHENSEQSNLLDLCCGSGCIGLTIKKYIPQFNLTSIDKYWGPILNTRQNAIKHKISLTIDCKDAIKYLNQLSKIDYLICNPPYINTNNFPNKKQILKWESKHALIAKDNGLYFYKEIFKWLNSHSFKEAWFEIGYDLIDNLKQELSKYNNFKYQIEEKKNYLVVYPK